MSRRRRRRRQEIIVLRFWENVMLDEGRDMKDRLKASEFLAKNIGLFCPQNEDAELRELDVKIDYGDGVF